MKILSLFKKLFPKSKDPLNFYVILGEETGLKKLVFDFYEIMETDPKAKNCLSVHELFEGKVDTQSKDRLFMFLSGWLGGPNLFVDNIGAPRMRMRHAHVKISESERVEWLYCMQQALRQKKLKMKERKIFLRSLEALSLRIKNR